MEELKEEARRRGLWNLFHPDPEYGPGLSNVEYAPLAEIMGRSAHRPEACNCSAPDTGNMEVLTQFGTPEQKERWLRPLLEGEIRSAFAMTEPDVASSDATNMQLRIERDGDEYVLNGRKWWTTGSIRERCRILIVMGKTNPDGAAPPAAVDDPRPARHARADGDAQPPRVRLRPTTRAHGEDLLFDDVRVPVSNLVGGEGDGFLISQARLGPGRIHHCMRDDRRGRARARADVPARVGARDVRQAGRRRARTCRTGSPSRGSRSTWPACSR